MNKTIILFASSRRNGNTGTLTDQIAREIGAEVVDLGEKDISPFDYEHRNRSDDFESLMDKVLSYENIAFASPIYWYSVAPPMKTFLDRISDYLDLSDLLEKGRKLRDKSGFVICTSVKDQPDEPFIEAFRQTFAYLGMNFGGFIHTNSKCQASYEKELQSFIQLLQK